MAGQAVPALPTWVVVGITWLRASAPATMELLQQVTRRLPWFVLDPARYILGDVRARMLLT